MARFILFLLVAGVSAVHADPLVTSWFTSISTKYARIYTSAANRTSGVSATTWTNGTQTQTNPAYAGVSEVNSSSNWIYIRASGLGGHVMGPWNNPNYPKNQGVIWRFPRNAAGAQTVAGQSTLTGLGAIGYFVDGVAAYNTSDGFAYSNANGTDASPTAGIGSGDGIWNRDAFTNESASFDFALAHNQAAGEYHYHVNPIAARYLAGDNINYNAATKNYSENTANTSLQHSPIVGWMKDGLPLYGPYGYDGGSTGAAATSTVSGGVVTAVNVTAGGTLYQSAPLVTFSGGGGSGAAATVVVTAGVVTAVTVTSGGSGYSSPPTVQIGGVRRMISGYQYRDGTNNTTNLNSTGRTTLPAWAALAQGRSATLASGQYGPNVDATYALGHYAEDYDYLGDLGYTQSSRTNSGGVFFDLNKFNVRLCVTPEYPNGTWAYFTTIKADGTSFYPYSVGRWYYGNPTGGSTDAATMSADGATTQVLAGANSAINVSTPVVSGGTVTLTWSSVEGGAYSVDASTNQSSWTSEKTGLAPTNVPIAPTTGNSAVTTTTSYTTLGSSGIEYARVNRTALATYDATGQTASTVAQSVTRAYSASGTNTPPTVSAIFAQSTAQNTPTGAIAFTVGDNQTTAASLVVTGSSNNTALVPNANIVTGGSDANRTVTITPATNQTGIATITISVSDGLDTTTTSFTLTVTASAPVISSISISPASPTSATSVTVTAGVTPPSGRTIAPPVQLAYTIGAGTTNTVFSETMASVAVLPWTGTGTSYAWAVTGPPNSFSQTTAANHGSGNACGLECNRASPSMTNTYMTTSNAINAAGTSAYVEFYVATANLSGTMGWDFQTSTDGLTWTTRVVETNSNHAYPASPYHYDLTAGERVSTLKLRFRFAGSGMVTPVSNVSLDDIKVVTTTASAPVTISMFDDGAHGDGAAGDGVYGASIPAQALGTTVTYTIVATDNTTATTTSNSAFYTVGTGAPALTVTPGSGLSSSGPMGGPFSPSGATWTLTNSGTASMNWTGGKTAAWLTLDTANGTLAAGQNTTVTGSINATANSLAAGAYGDTITFTNGTNGIGSTTRSASLTVNVTGLSALESWQQAWFGTTSNTGSSAYTADPYHTGVANLLAFAFMGPNQNPATAAVSQLPRIQVDGGNAYFSFTQPAGVSGIVYGAEWSTTLEVNGWTPISDSGSGSQRIFSVPIGSNTRMFFRLTATSP